ncbi:MAG: ATP-binding protein [Phycisphaerales bacterium]|nr:ATP-binding protein [Phycisphaerales bacterium]
MLLLGPPGTGKSHLAQAIGHAVIKARRHRALSLHLRSGPRLPRRRSRQRTRENPRPLSAARSLVIIDDMGMKQPPQTLRRVPVRDHHARYQVRATMMTSNRPLEDWGKLIGDVPAATAILDRFLHNAEVINITGRSYRLRDHAAKPEATQKKKPEPACEPVAK